MSKSTNSKTTEKTDKPAPHPTRPRQAIKQTLARASKLAEMMVQAIEEEMGKTGTNDRSERIFGPRGAVANLQKLMQVLTKLNDQLESLQEQNAKKPDGGEPISKEDIHLLQEWLKS